MAFIKEPRTTRSGWVRHDVRWRGPDYNAKGHLKEHQKSFATRTEAEAFLATLPPMQQVPALCGCDPARWVLIDASVLALGPLTCSICGKPFAPFTPAEGK